MNLIPRKYYLDNFFDDFTIGESNFMRCDIYEKDNKYHIELDIPGFKKEDINIECKDGNLTVTAKRESREDINNKNYIKRERSYGEFSRQFYLGDIDTDKINAKFNNGTLLITIPLEDKSNNSKKIEIGE